MRLHQLLHAGAIRETDRHDDPSDGRCRLKQLKRVQDQRFSGKRHKRLRCLAPKARSSACCAKSSSRWTISASARAPPPFKVMSDLFCIYEGPVEKDGVVVGGAVNLRTKEGFVVAAFATVALARWFMSAFKLEDGGVKRTVIPLSALGTAAYPRRASKGLPQPFRKIAFPSQEILEAWARDRAHFPTAPHVSKLWSENV